jgi:hypothetical protein
MHPVRQAFSSIKNWIRSNGPFLIKVAALAVFFAVFRRIYIWVFLQGRFVDDSIYHTPSMVLASLKSPVNTGIFLLSIWLVRSARKTVTWGTTNLGLATKILIFSIVLILTWNYSTYDYNFFLNQSHWIDRLLLITLAGSVLFSPLAVVFHLPVLYIIFSQFGYPLGGASTTDKIMLFELEMLFAAFVMWSAFGQRMRSLSAKRSRLFSPFFSEENTLHSEAHFTVFWVIALAVVGSCYFFPGLKKLSIGPTYVEWFLNDRLDNMAASGFLRRMGSLQTLIFGANAFTKIIGFVEAYRKPLLTIAVLIELSGFLILANRKLATLFLLAAIGLHFGIAFVSGIFFWKWILIDLVLLFLIVSNKVGIAQLFTKRNFIASLLLLCLAAPLWSPPTLGWFDLKNIYYFTISVEGKSGQLYSVDPNYMDPYDLYFSFMRYFFLVDNKIFVGSTEDYNAASKIQASTLDDIQAIEDELGENYYDPALAAQFEDFLKVFFQSLNEHPERKDIIPNFLRPPYHIQFLQESNEYAAQEPVDRIIIGFVEQYFDGKAHSIYREETVLDFALDE